MPFNFRRQRRLCEEDRRGNFRVLLDALLFVVPHSKEPHLYLHHHRPPPGSNICMGVKKSGNGQIQLVQENCSPLRQQRRIFYTYHYIRKISNRTLASCFTVWNHHVTLLKNLFLLANICPRSSREMMSDKATVIRCDCITQNATNHICLSHRLSFFGLQPHSLLLPLRTMQLLSTCAYIRQSEFLVSYHLWVQHSLSSFSKIKDQDYPPRNCCYHSDHCQLVVIFITSSYTL